MKRRVRAPVPLATAALTAASVVVYGLELAGDGQALCEEYGLIPAHPTVLAASASTLLHDPNGLWHVGGNVVALTLFGVVVERCLGHFRFVALYVLGGLGAAAFHVFANPGSVVPEVGASGPIFALMAAAAMLRPRLVSFVAAFVAINILQTVTGSGGEVATAAHLGGFVAGFVVTLVVFHRQLGEVRGWRRGARALTAGAA